MNEGKDWWVRYRIPLILGGASVFLIIFSITLFIKSFQSTAPITFSSDEASGSGQASTIVIDIAGAVVNPGVYALPTSSRVEDAIAAAGGLSADVDGGRLATSVNRAAILSDGAKLYIPKVGDAPNAPNAADFLNLISVNAASQSELEALSGIGPATAKKIIAGRPYTSLEDLVARKAIGQALYDKLKNQLSL